MLKWLRDLFSRPLFSSTANASPSLPGSRMKQAAFVAAVVAFVGGWEGMYLVTYRDVVGVPTICYGETKGVKMGESRTKQQCDAQLISSLKEHEAGMLKCLKHSIPPDVQLAFLSFTYNVGVGAFCKSTLLKKANSNDIRGACDELLKWDKAGGRTYAGLTKRRAAEREICLRGSR